MTRARHTQLAQAERLLAEIRDGLFASILSTAGTKQVYRGYAATVVLDADMVRIILRLDEEINNVLGEEPK